MRPTVFLFDIDGTLVTTGGAGRRSIERAFEVLHGRPDACSHFKFGGMTDQAIARQGLEQIGVEATPHAIDEVLARYVALLEVEVAQVPDATYRVHPGMREAVSAAAKAPGVALGLGTGNVREGARVKLERVGLFHHFAFGGFGDDHELRPELIRRGAERGLALLGVKAARVVVIGDTPKDIEAAEAIGAESIAVTTGGFTRAQLAHATHVFDTLADDGALAALLPALPLPLGRGSG